MDKTLNATPVSSRTHIGFFGRMNAGKSSVINALADQPVSIVSDKAGTTTDVVKKTMEIHGIGPCVLLDTAGFDDEGELGKLRIKASEKAADSTDIAVILFTDEDDWSYERRWWDSFRSIRIPAVAVLNKCDERDEAANDALAERIKTLTGAEPIRVSAVTREGIDDLREALIAASTKTPDKLYIMGDLVKKDDVVLLVMPQDPQAPEGRLIIPEVQTIREALDRHCVAVCVQPEEMQAALAALKEPPHLIVTDSQVFDEVYKQKPEGSKLTSFSVLFAGFKGDIDYYIDSVKAIESLNENSKVLIAECCTHAPLDEDIGRVKIPRMLRQRFGQGLTVDVTAGADFTDHPEDYDLIIQCGGCMFNRRYVCSRIQKAKDAGVPMTNYGITIAYVKGILDKIDTGREEKV